MERCPSKIAYIGAEGAFRKILGSVGQKWISEKVSKGGPFGSAGGQIPEGGGGVRPPPPPPPLNPPLHKSKTTYESKYERIRTRYSASYGEQLLSSVLFLFKSCMQLYCYVSVLKSVDSPTRQQSCIMVDLRPPFDLEAEAFATSPKQMFLLGRIHISTLCKEGVEKSNLCNLLLSKISF